VTEGIFLPNEGLFDDDDDELKKPKEIHRPTSTVIIKRQAQQNSNPI